MTRINCVPVTELSGKHLAAEYRELPRLYALAAAAHERGETHLDHGDTYKLGPGHVRFFYSRLGYITKRHRELIKEMKARGYKPQFVSVPPLTTWPRTYGRNWQPCAAAQAINRARLLERGGGIAPSG